MPTVDQILEYTPFLGWFAMSAIVAALIKVTQFSITRKMERTSRALRLLDRLSILVTLPLCVCAGFFLPVPEALEADVPSYLYWGSTWVGALMGRKRIDIRDRA